MVVVDNSAILPLFLSDENAELAESLLLSSVDGEELIAPVLWLTEFGNALLVCERRKRIDEEQREEAHRKASRLPITIDSFPSLGDLPAIHELCQKYQLSFYDGTYLALTLHRGARLATQDKQLKKAAIKEGILYEK